MRLFGWFKKPQAPVEPLIFTKEDSAKLDEIIKEADIDDSTQYIDYGPPLQASPLSPPIGSSLSTASTVVRQIPVIFADSEPALTPPPLANPATDSDSSYATIAVAKRIYRDSVVSALSNKLRSL